MTPDLDWSLNKNTGGRFLKNFIKISYTFCCYCSVVGGGGGGYTSGVSDFTNNRPGNVKQVE